MPPAVPRSGPNRRLGSINQKKPPPKAKVKQQAKKPDCCDAPELEDADGMKVCVNCGTMLEESNIVSDVTFEEDSRGAATVQGGFIGLNARHANTLGAGAFKRIGGGDRNSRQETENNGRRALAPIVQRLAIPSRITEQAQHIFGVVATYGFNAGRRTEEVAAACLYAACRREQENNVMLMDIAEIIKVNVFRLGEVYKALCKKCYVAEMPVGDQNLIALEPLILKYCNRLEFGASTHAVATDAVRIAQRMRRDWIVTGRHPAGLVGACIILGARMNNFRRSVREVVFVSKVADGTVARRIEEFRRTKAAGLSIDEFRQYGVYLKHAHDPPALQNSKEMAEKFEEKKRKRQEHNTIRETMERETAERETMEPDAIDIPDDASSRATSAAPDPTPDEEEQPQRKRRRTEEQQATPDATQQEPQVTPDAMQQYQQPAPDATQHEPQATPDAMQQDPRRDADGFVIPDIPASRVAVRGAVHDSATEPPKRKRGRPKKHKPETVDISREELINEAQLQAEIDLALVDEGVQLNSNEIERVNREERTQITAEQERQRAAEKEQIRREQEGVTWWANKEVNNDEVLDEDDLAKEFENDPEVINCQLSEVESRIKEQIWVTHNEDWMRQQHEKEIIRKMAEANGEGKEKKTRGGKGRKKKGKPGEPGLNDAETPAETPADGSTAAILAKRAPAGISKFLNYEALQSMYNQSPGSGTTSASQSRAASEAPSVTESSRPSATPEPGQNFGLQSPQATQLIPASPGPQDLGQPPASPSQTQAQATEGAQEEGGEQEEEIGEEEEEAPPQSDVGSPAGEWDDDNISEVQDYGDDADDQYERAIDEGWRGEDSFEGEDEYY